MNNVTILMSNVKGGCGKTTLSSLLSTYLVERGFPVVVFDSDTQLSLMKNRRDDLSLTLKSVEEPWKVFPLRADEKVKEHLKRASQKKVLKLFAVTLNSEICALNIVTLKRNVKI